MPFATTLRLNSGTEIPSIGLGTFLGGPEADNSLVKEVVSKALALGYRHFDTAYQYGTERYVGQAIKESDVPRSDIFLTSKLCVTPRVHSRGLRSNVDV